MTDVERVREALRQVVDPCSAATGSDLDIVEMGLVKSISIDGSHVDVDLRLTTPACTMHPYFIREAGTAVRTLPGIESVDVQTDNGVEWREEMMSEAAIQRREEVLNEYEVRYGGEPG